MLSREAKVDLLAAAVTAAVVFYDQDPRRVELAVANGLRRAAHTMRAAGTWVLTQSIRTENWAKEWAA